MVPLRASDYCFEPIVQRKTNTKKSQTAYLVSRGVSTDMSYCLSYPDSVTAPYIYQLGDILIIRSLAKHQRSLLQSTLSGRDFEKRRSAIDLLLAVVIRSNDISNFTDEAQKHAAIFHFRYFRLTNTSRLPAIMSKAYTRNGSSPSCHRSMLVTSHFSSSLIPVQNPDVQRK